MSHGSILYLGAPTQKQLEHTWNSNFLVHSPSKPTQPTPLAEWRRLVIPGSTSCRPSGIAGGPDEGISTGSLEASIIRQEADMSNISLPTQYPNFDFDMSAVLDLEDIYHLALPARVSLLAAILHIGPLTPMQTKSGESVLVVLTMGDATSNGLEITIWGHQALFVTQHLRRMDIVLLRDINVVHYMDQVVGQSRYGSQFSVLYRVDRKTEQDDALRPLLAGDLQSERVAAVRDWAITWVPSETQPEHTQAG